VNRDLRRKFRRELRRFAACAMVVGSGWVSTASTFAQAVVAKSAHHYAGQEAQRFADRARAIAEQHRAPFDQFRAVTGQIKDAEAKKVAAEAGIAALTAQVQQLEAAQAAVDALANGAAATVAAGSVGEPGKLAAAGAAQLKAEHVKIVAERKAKLAESTTALAAAQKAIADLAGPLKAATDAKVAAEKIVGDATTAAKTAVDRLTVLNMVGDKPDPTKIREVQRLAHNRGLLNCRFDDDGERLWTGAEDHALHRWDWIGGGHEVFAGHKSWVGSLAFLGTGHPVVTGGYEGQLLFWDAVGGKGAPVRTIDAHKGFLRSIAISPDGQWIATGGNDKLARVWKAADGTLATELSGHASHVYSVAFSRDGKRLISGDLKGVVKDWEVGTWKHVRDIDAAVLTKYDAGFQADVGGVRCVDFSPDGKLVALGGIGEVSNAFAGVGKPIITLIDWETGKSLRVLEPADAFQGSVYGLRFSKDGDFLVGAGGGGSAGAIWFWRPGEVKSFHMLKVDQVCRDLAMHPDGLRLAVPCFDNSLRLYDMTPTP
jgi:WD40 repeat protein